MKKCLILLALYGLATLITLEAGEKRLPLKGEAFTIEGHTAFLILPEKPKAGQPIPWVWYAPTLRGLPGREETWMFERFLKGRHRHCRCGCGGGILRQPQGQGGLFSAA
jgi:hypothetical protein